MSIGVFTDKQRIPKDREVNSMLGSARRSWDGMIQFVEETYSVKGEWKYYGKNYGWALRFRKSGKALVSLYPDARSFAAQIILGESAIEKTRTMKLGKKVRETINKAHPYPEGRWLFLAIASSADMRDAENLLLLKAPPRISHSKRSGGSGKLD